MMAEALGRWAREEMELPPSAAPSPAALRRLCSGPTAPIWDFITCHVRSQRNVKKIRGNLRWYRHLQEMEVPPVPPSRRGALQAAAARSRKELRALGAAILDAQEVTQRLEASLEAGQRRRWAELQRGAELRLLGAEPSPDWLLGAVPSSDWLRETARRPGQSRAELSAILASGAEPEVLVSIKALCKAREAELRRPRPPRRPEPRDWLEQAEAVLIGHSPGAVLWALEALANQSTRALLTGTAPSPEAPPTLKILIQERWGAVGGVWAALPPLLSRLAPLRLRLRRLRPRLDGHRELSLVLSRAFFSGFLGSLRRQLRDLGGDPENSQNSQNSQNSSQKSPPKSPNLAPKSQNSALRRLRRGRGRVLRQQQRLRFLSAATRGRRAGLRALQEQVVGVARAGPGSAPPPLEGEGRRRRSLVLGALGALGALGEPLPPPGAPPPLRGMGREMGAEQQGALLARAAILRQQLRQGALRARRGAWPARGAEPEQAPPLPAQEGVAELLPQLRLVGNRCRQRITAWPRLQELISQWWTQPAQWALATPPGHAPFSHWLQRWRGAAHALQATPPGGEGEGPAGEATPP